MLSAGVTMGTCVLTLVSKISHKPIIIQGYQRMSTWVLTLVFEMSHRDTSSIGIKGWVHVHLLEYRCTYTCVWDDPQNPHHPLVSEGEESQHHWSDLSWRLNPGKNSTIKYSIIKSIMLDWSQEWRMTTQCYRTRGHKSHQPGEGDSVGVAVDLVEELQGR